MRASRIAYAEDFRILSGTDKPFTQRTGAIMKTSVVAGLLALVAIDVPAQITLTCQPDRFEECGMAWSFDIPTAVTQCINDNVTISVASTVTNVAIPRCPAIFSVTRTWRATDTCGNSAFCNQTVTIVDTEPPDITCGADKEAQCGTAWAFDIPTAVDKCDLNNVLIEVVSTVTNVAIPRCPAIFSVTRTWRTTDTCGNSAFCNQTVTIVDTEPPDITCAGDQIVECGIPFAFTRPFAVDVCDGTNVTVLIVSTVTNVTSLGCPELFSVRRTWSATDTCGNESFCSQTIVVVDTRPPVLTCGEDRFVECGFPWSFISPRAYDICDGTNVTVVMLNTVTNTVCGGSFIATRTWLATDQCGNGSSCSQSIYVLDTVPPSINCAADRVVECGIPWSFTRPSAQDVCDGTNVTVMVDSTVTNALCGQTFAATRTWRATDQCGNEALCSQTVMVVDTTPPTITCASNKTVECTQAWTFDDPTASDTCDGTNVTIAIVSTVTNAGPTKSFIATRTWLATDGCSNLASCSQTVTILPCPQDGGCRVTGGSNHQTNSYQAACIMTPWPTYTSHGGQVGAPFSVATPFTPNSPCISGEWQHNRHLQGNGLVGMFHASGHGVESQFDSLLCACLPCDQNPNAMGVVGSLCNPSDRLCGPQPRHASANKVCFSGVGDYTFAPGNQSVKAVFRVDIEDRSEGNSQANSLPPDRYRIRLWLLDPACGRNPDPESAEAMALRLAASADPTKIASLATTEDLKVNVPPDIDDGGELTQGNHQIHPAAAASCGAFVPAPAAAIDVATEVACLKPGGDCKFATTVRGFQGLQNPTFVYRITITNCGAVTLSNLSVAETTDSILDDTTGVYFAAGATLLPGDSTTRYYTNTLGADSIHSIVVSANSPATADLAVANSSAMVSLSLADLNPRLSIYQAGKQTLLSWPIDAAPDALLETTTSLIPPVIWSSVPNATTPFVLPDTPAGSTRFYRLRTP